MFLSLMPRLLHFFATSSNRSFIANLWSASLECYQASSVLGWLKDIFLLRTIFLWASRDIQRISLTGSEMYIIVFLLKVKC